MRAPPGQRVNRQLQALGHLGFGLFDVMNVAGLVVADGDTAVGIAVHPVHPAADAVQGADLEFKTRLHADRLPARLGVLFVLVKRLQPLEAVLKPLFLVLAGIEPLRAPALGIGFLEILKAERPAFHAGFVEFLHGLVHHVAVGDGKSGGRLQSEAVGDLVFQRASQIVVDRVIGEPQRLAGKRDLQGLLQRVPVAGGVAVQLLGLGQLQRWSFVFAQVQGLLQKRAAFPKFFAAMVTGVGQPQFLLRARDRHVIKAAFFSDMMGAFVVYLGAQAGRQVQPAAAATGRKMLVLQTDNEDHWPFQSFGHMHGRHADRVSVQFSFRGGRVVPFLDQRVQIADDRKVGPGFFHLVIDLYLFEEPGEVRHLAFRGRERGPIFGQQSRDDPGFGQELIERRRHSLFPGQLLETGQVAQGLLNAFKGLGIELRVLPGARQVRARHQLVKALVQG